METTEATIATIQAAGIHEDLARELDSLGEKVELAAQVIGQLRTEGTELRGQIESLRRERQRILDAAGMRDTADLLRAVDRIKELEQETRALRQERGEVARRLGLLAEKVDLLDRDS
jgi:chromosome segregation ATPase